MSKRVDISDLNGWLVKEKEKGGRCVTRSLALPRGSRTEYGEPIKTAERASPSRAGPALSRARFEPRAPPACTRWMSSDTVKRWFKVQEIDPSKPSELALCYYKTKSDAVRARALDAAATPFMLSHSRAHVPPLLRPPPLPPNPDGGRARVTHFVRARAQDDKRGKSEPRGWMYLGDITSVSNEGDIIVIEHPTRYGARPPRRRERAARA